MPPGSIFVRLEEDFFVLQVLPVGGRFSDFGADWLVEMVVCFFFPVFTVLAFHFSICFHIC